jgi:hypothetical protein
MVLHLIKKSERPLGPLTIAEKRAKAIAYLRKQGIYVLDRGARKPKWGNGNKELA